MIMAHDSATTYLEGGAWHQINQWTKTQSGGSFSALLECGARSFDFRPKLKSDGSLIMHHGPVDVDHPMGDALDEVLQWADTQDRNASNLIHLDIWDCEQSDSDQGSCWDKIESLLEGKNLSVVECDDLKSKTVDDIFSLSRVVVTDGCVTANYDESVTCSGFGGKASNLRALAASKNSRYVEANLRTTNVDMSLYYTCYADSDSKAFPLDRMWSYLNQLTASRIRSGEIDASKLNLVEINNVCDGGSDILAALREVKGVITFKFTSPSGMWTVDLKTGKGSVYQGKAKKKANLTLTMKAKDFVDMAQGKLNGQQAFMSGKLKMKGNMGLAMKLGNIMATVSM
eukprot:g467.t1